MHTYMTVPKKSAGAPRLSHLGIAPRLGQDLGYALSLGGETATNNLASQVPQPAMRNGPRSGNPMWVRWFGWICIYLISHEIHDVTIFAYIQ